MRWTRVRYLTKGADADGEIAWSRSPDAEINPQGSRAGGTVATSPDTGESAYKP